MATVGYVILTLATLGVIGVYCIGSAATLKRYEPRIKR